MDTTINDIQHDTVAMGYALQGVGGVFIYIYTSSYSFQVQVILSIPHYMSSCYPSGVLYVDAVNEPPLTWPSALRANIDVHLIKHSLDPGPACSTY